MSDAERSVAVREAQAAPAENAPRRKRANMHQGKAVWCDCCSCEAEPRWEAVAAELGISLSDYEQEGEEEGQAEDAGTQAGGR